jgi:hypothetical protein
MCSSPLLWSISPASRCKEQRCKRKRRKKMRRRRRKIMTMTVMKRKYRRRRRLCLRTSHLASRAHRALGRTYHGVV